MDQINKVNTIDDTEKLEKIFLKRETRKVKTDGTISFKKKMYEVPPSFIGKKIEIRFDPGSIDEVFIYNEGEEIAKAQPVNFNENAYMKRKRHLSFHNIETAERNED